jgi:hypothetical protein
MLLLDIAYPGRLPRHLPDTLRRVKKVIIDTIQPLGKTEVPDTIDSVPPVQDSARYIVNNLSVTDGGSSSVQLADVAPIPPETSVLGSDDMTTTILAIVAVLAALSLCLHFVFRYRRATRSED